MPTTVADALDGASTGGGTGTGRGLPQELPTELLGLLDRIAGAHGAWGPALHPSGRKIAYVTDRTGLPRLEVVEVDGLAAGGVPDAPAGVTTAVPQQVSLPDQEVVSASWSPDGQHLLYLVAPDGLIRAELHAVGADGRGHRLVAGGGGMETVVAGAWTADGRYVCTVADGVGPDAAVVVVTPGDDGRADDVRELAPADYQVVTSADAATGRAVVRRGRRGHRALWLVDLAEGGQGHRLLQSAVALAEDRGEDGRVDGDGTGVTLRTDALPVTGGRVALVRVPLDEDGVPGLPVVLLAREDADLEAALPLPGGAHLCRWNVRGRSEVEVRHLASTEVAEYGWEGDGAPGSAPAGSSAGSSAPTAGRVGGLGEAEPVDVEPALAAAGPAPDLAAGPPAEVLVGSWEGAATPPAPRRPVARVASPAARHLAADLTPEAVVQRLPLPPGAQVVMAWALTPDGSGVVLEASGPALPRSLWWMALPGGGVEEAGVPQLLGCTPPHELPVDLVVPELQRYTAPDGVELEGWAYRPVGTSGPVPTVLFLHGGPEAQERPLLSRLAQCLLAAGVGVFAPNIRGSDGYGAHFRGLDDLGARWSSMTDVITTVEHVLASGLAAPGLVGVHGWSYGGYLTLASLCRWPDVFAAGSSLAGMSSLMTFFAKTESWMAAASTTEYGDPATDAVLLEEISPMTHLDRIACPVLLSHGDRDTNVPLGESVQAHDALTALGRPCELVVLPGEGHSVVGTAGILQFARALTGFYVRHLQPGVERSAA
ncbi:S9 family peptidase [Pseudokineococcus sp. 1T1Z-3]|uniref:S9 family peptidase n=1 Tax=Pseudokineococcus sp. 1T1Z-3 TaxID=3132745 RepID=UPI0030B2F69C